jgi:chromosome partitioning protein
MRKVVIINFKGGVGKTTTAVNVSSGLAAAGKKVLLVDNDPQANSTFVFTKAPRFSLASLLRQKVTLDKVVVNVRPNLDLIPASKALSTINTWLVESKTLRRAQVLDRILAPVEGYDFVIIDTAPSYSLLNANAICWATEAWVPVAMEFLALANIRELMNVFSTAKTNLGKELSISYVIPYMYDGRNRKSKQIHNILIDIFGELVTNPIRSDVRISEAPYHSKTIREYEPRCRGAKDFERLINRILEENALYQTRDEYSEFFST